MNYKQIINPSLAKAKTDDHPPAFKLLSIDLTMAGQKLLDVQNRESDLKTQPLISGDSVPVLGLGTWKIEPEKVGQVVTDAIELGYRHFDCAMIYVNEAEIGVAFNKILQSNSVRREGLWITSKLWNNSHLANDVQPALEKTLQDLQLDYLDLYLMHWPVAHKQNVVGAETGDDFLSLEDAPLVDTWLAMENCLKSGLCRNIGVSNFSQKKLQHLIDHGNVVPAMNQVEAHPLLQQNNLLNFCNQHKIGFTAYSPLGSGDRPGRMRKENEPRLFEIDEIIQIANRHEVSAAAVLVAWAINRGTLAIPKSASGKHLADNLQAADLQLSNDEMNIIAGLDRHYRFVDGTFWEKEGSGYTVGSLWDE